MLGKLDHLPGIKNTTYLNPPNHFIANPKNALRETPKIYLGSALIDPTQNG